MNKKQYVRKILRRIQVTDQIKKRIGRDILTELESKEEEGLSIDEIIAQKGTPQEVADAFNQAYGDTDMSRRYRVQNSLKITSAVLILTALIMLVCSAFAAQDASVAIIGGADGPTQIFLKPHSLNLIIVKITGLAFLLIGAVCAVIYFVRGRKQ